jgi:hypothetical protein
VGLAAVLRALADAADVTLLEADAADVTLLEADAADVTFWSDKLAGKYKCFIDVEEPRILGTSEMC